MSQNAISQYLDEILKDWRGSRSLFLRNDIKSDYWPIPFFGNPIKAKIATIAVNPSSTEFRKVRCWAEVRTDQQWKERLWRYFKHSISPHPWFDPQEQRLAEEFRSYRQGSAFHLDISYRPTIAMLRNPATDRREFVQMIERDVVWMFKLLPLCPKLRELRAIGPILLRNEKIGRVIDFVAEKAPAHGFDVSRVQGGCLLSHRETGRKFQLRPM